MVENTDRQGLLVVDVQVGVMDESVNAAQTVERIAGLVERARSQGVPVIWVQHSDEGLEYGSAAWQLVPELQPAEGEVRIEKRYSDSFAETDLAEQLGRLGVTRLVLCGAQTDACIRNTFYGGIYRGYPVTLVSDAHTTGDLRQWGAEFSAEQSIAVLNMQASWTRLPDVAGAVIAAEEAFVS